MRERKLIGVPEVQATRPYGLGIDCAKDVHAICLLIPDGTNVVRYEWECPNELDPLMRSKRRLQVRLSSFLLQAPLSYTLESTATYHYPLMRAWGGRPCIVNPALAASFKARKTDRIDAYKLALHHLEGLWPYSHIPSAATEVLRMLTRSRVRFMVNRGRIIRGLNTRLWQWNCPPKPHGAGHSLVRAMIEDLARGQYHGDAEMFAAAKFVPEIVWQWMVHSYAAADAILKEQKWIEAQIDNMGTSHLREQLELIPSIGPVTSATWEAEVEPATRFTSSNKCVAFCGLDPTPQISGGKKVGSRLRLGNKFMRAALIQAASGLLNGKSALGQKFRKAKGPHKRRVCVAARHLAILMYRCSVEGVVYDEAKVAIPESEQ